MTETIEPRWRKWVAENKILGNDDRVIVNVLTRNGIPAELATREVADASAHPYAHAGLELAQLLKKLESVLAIQRELQLLDPDYGTIRRLERPSRLDFLRQHYATNTPAILTGMLEDWPARTRWTWESLQQKLAGVPVEVQVDRDSDRMYERNIERHRKLITFDEYLRMVLTAGETNDFYMVANNKNLDRTGLAQLLDDVVMFPELLDASQAREKVFFWFGPKGTITPVHHDPMNVLLAQVRGRKKVKLFSPAHTPLLYNYVGVFSEVDVFKPDLARYPLFAKAKPIEFVLEEGEVLFIPVGWWHAVVSLDVSISVSMTNFAIPNSFSWQNPSVYR